MNLSKTEGTLYVPGPGFSLTLPVTFGLPPNPNVILSNLDCSARLNTGLYQFGGGLSRVALSAGFILDFKLNFLEFAPSIVFRSYVPGPGISSCLVFIPGICTFLYQA